MVAMDCMQTKPSARVKTSGQLAIVQTVIFISTYGNRFRWRKRITIWCTPTGFPSSQISSEVMSGAFVWLEASTNSNGVTYIVITNSVFSAKFKTVESYEQIAQS